MTSIRSQIPYSVVYPAGTGIYASNSPSTFSSTTSVGVNSLEPVIGTSFTVTNRDTGNAAPVYVAETGATLVSPLVTDAGGNIPGWVDAGSYAITVTHLGAFAGATYNYESFRGDGITLFAPGAVTQTAIAPGAVDMPQLSLAVQALLNSIPGLAAAIAAGLLAGSTVATGTVAYSIEVQAQYSGPPTYFFDVTSGNNWQILHYWAPPGWLACYGQLVPIAIYRNLFETIGYSCSVPTGTPTFLNGVRTVDGPPPGYFYLPTSPYPFDALQNAASVEGIFTMIKT